jgi:hypothetical protein
MWRPHCSWNRRRKKNSTACYDSYLFALSKDCNFHRLKYYSLFPVSWLVIRGWGRPSVLGADKSVKWSISHSHRAAVSCVETAHSSSVHVSSIWFFCKFDPLIWGIVPSWVQKAHGKPRWANKMNRKREKISTVRPAGLKTRRSFIYTIITNNSYYWLRCCSLHNAKIIIGD